MECLVNNSMALHITSQLENEFIGLLNKVDSKKILGGKSVEESADIFVKILGGKGSESQVNVVLANSSLAIRTLTGKDIEECYSIAKESLESGKAYNCLKKLIEL